MQCAIPRTAPYHALRHTIHAGVESSFCMLLTAHYVMRLLVPSAREATIHPFAHQGLANCRSAADRCRPVTCLSLLADGGPLVTPRWSGAGRRPGHRVPHRPKAEAPRP